MATAIALGKDKQGEVWIEGSGQASCPQLGRMEHVNKFVELKPDQKYAIMPEKGVRIAVCYVLINPEHIASHQHEILTKNKFPAPAFAYHSWMIQR